MLVQPLRDHDPGSIGPYRLLGRLGAGGMGQVYLAADRDGQVLAVKVVHPALAHDEAFRRRFRHEVAATRQISGVWVAAVVDATRTRRPRGSPPSTSPARHSTGRWPAPGRCPRPPGTCWPAGSPARSPWCTPPGWCTATSSRPTCCWPTGRG
ncbi:hypothetical protein BJF78_35340 [Pseudonocardia sp. CNS-139]|nr:hypothetical protein BJF78_35340 [Pseudonocardia sp. CNS-139]